MSCSHEFRYTMRVIDPGHDYALDVLDGIQSDNMTEVQRLVFVKREGENYPGNVGHHAGTTTQEVLRACVDRLRYVNGQIASSYTEEAIRLLRQAIWVLEVRAADRHGRAVTFDLDGAEKGRKCSRCGHVGCLGGCHGR